MALALLCFLSCVLFLDSLDPEIWMRFPLLLGVKSEE